MNAFERETVVNASDGDEIVRIYCQQRRYITRLRRNPRFTEIGSGTHNDGTVWAEFTIPASDWNPASGARRSKTMSLDARKAAGDRLRALRAQQS